MATPINLPVNAQLQNVTQLQRQIQQATQNLRINLVSGNSARSLTALSQPLGRLTGQADEFTKSLEAANARVLAFGASVGVVNAVTNAFKSLVNSTIEVEKAITAISVVGDQFAGKNKQLSQGLFSIAKATGQSFAEVSKAALEFSRQGLDLEKTLQRTQDALVLTRLTGLDAAKSVEGLTAAVNGFSKAGLTTTQILNKLAAVDQAFAVSSADLIEGFNRSASVAQNAGISFDELAGIITSLQTTTSRGGSVIGNALKTIFTRLQDTGTLEQLQDLGIAVVDVENNLLPARQILQNLAGDVEKLGAVTRAGIFKDVAGAFQINQLISLVSDLNNKNSIAAAATQKSAGATNEAAVANDKLNQSLGAILNTFANTGKQLGALLGDIGLTDGLKSLLNGLNAFVEGASDLLQGESLGSKFAKGIVEGIGSILTGPGVGLFIAIIATLSARLAKFGIDSLKTFFNIGQATKQQQQLQESIVQTLVRNQSVLSQILNTQGGQNAQAQAFLNILKQEEQVLQNIRTIAGGIAAPLVAQGYRAGAQGIQRRSAGGYLPAQEAADVRRGVGGASPSSQVVAIPNFAFGGGKRGTMIANTSEYIVPNYAGGGSAIFNQDMVKTMGLPPGARKITASGGFIPNFANAGKTVLDRTEKFAMIVNDQNGIKQLSASPKKDSSIVYKFNSYGIPSTTQLKNKKGGAFADSRFTNENLIERYTKAAIKESNAYALAIGGRALAPFEIEKLSNPGVVKGLVGAIFESGIGGVINGEGLRKAQADQNSNALIDFVGQPQINDFFGIASSIPYVEAKYKATSDALTSMANKIYNVERSATSSVSNLTESEKNTLRQQWLQSGGKGAIYGELTKKFGLNPGTNKEQRDAAKAEITKILSASSGYIPNFAASALMDAISREKSAGLSASQIYVDQSPALKSSSNPMGLMVANRRDEPAGGFQGIARARKEGMNPKTYGAAKGFVPNFFSYSPSSARYAPAPAPVGGDSGDAGNVGGNSKQSSGGDALAKVFALQSALVGLTAVFEETAGEGSALSEGFKTIGGVVAGVLSGATLLSAGLGPLGVALAALTSGFNIVKAVWPNAIQQLSEAFGALSKEGKKASENLNKFGEKVATGGVSPQQALEDARQQANEAQLRVRARLSRLEIANPEGKEKDLGVLQRELVIDQARKNLANTQFGAQIFKQTGSFSVYEGGAKSPIFGVAEAQFKDLNESSQNVILDILEETVSTNKEGLLALGKKLNINPKTKLIKESELSEYRSQLLQAVFNQDQVKKYVDDAIRESRDVKNQLNQNEFQEALKRSGLSDFVVKLIEDSIKNLPSIEAALPQNQLRVNLDNFLRTFNNFSAEIDRSVAATTSLFEGVLGSKTFSSLSEQRQFQLQSQLDTFKFTTSSNKTERGLISEAKGLVAAQAKEIATTEGDRQLLDELNNFVTNFSNLGDLETNLNNFASRLQLTGDKAIEFKNQVSELISKNKDFQSSRETERRLLQFSIQERQNELNSIKSFYDGLEGFNKGIREQEAKIRQIDFDIKLSQQRTDFEREMVGLNTGDLDTFRSETRRVENEGFIRELNLSENRAKIQAKIELDRALYTQDNIIALNRNTEALEEMYKEFSLERVQNQIDEILTRPSGIAESDRQKLEILQNTRANLLNSSLNNAPNQNSQDILKNLMNAGTPQAQGEILNSIANESQRNRIKEIFETYSNALEIAAENTEQQTEFQNRALDQAKDLDKARDRYSSTLNAEARQIEESLRRQPMSMGQYLSQRRQLQITQEESNMSPEAIREYRSSFGRGFGDSITEIQAKTADFKNEIGREIPNLFSQNLSQGLNDAISGAKSLKDALRDAATSFFQAMTQRNIQNLADIFTGGIGGFFTKKASGGLISGGSGAKDDVPAMLMGGEYVIKKSAVKKYGSGFFDALNKGSIKGFASGGGVQSGAGGFYVPGDYGEGSIRGKGNLLAFAGQSFTSGQYDRMGTFGLGGASVSLEAESARLTAFGRENSPLFERVQQSKEEAFKVYLDQLNQEKQYRDQLKQMEQAEKERQKQLITSVVSAVATSVLSAAASAGTTGFKNAAGVAKADGAGLGGQFSAGLGGIFKGSGGYGGLKNLFGGNFQNAFQSYGKAVPIADYEFIGGKLVPANFGPDFGKAAFRASGGMIYGGSGTRDDVPAMLTGGEFVLNNRATRKLGVQNLNRLNAGETGGGEDRSGAVTESLLSKLDELIQATRESSSENVVVNVSSSEAQGPTENTGGTEKELQRKIRQAVLDVIAQEKRLGGSLNKDNR